MAGPSPPYWKDHVAFCRHHEFDHKIDLEPQFKEAFEAFGHDYIQIRGSVSFFIKDFHILIFSPRMHQWLCSSCHIIIAMKTLS